MAKDTIVVPTTKKPTFWNRDAALGFFGGLLVPVPFASIIGLIAGGTLGKQRMEKDVLQGKQVNPPTAWNKTLIIGAGAALLIAAIAVPAITLPLIWTATEAVAVPVMALGLAVLATSPLIGAVIGSGMGKKRLTNDYAEAKAFEAYSQEQSRYMGQSPSASRSQAFGVTADEVAQMESRFANADKASFVDKLGNQAEIAQTNAR